MALETISTDHGGLREVSIYTLFHSLSIDDLSNPSQIIEESCRRCADLDRVLVKLAESRVAHVKVVYSPGGGTEELRTCLKALLPGITMRVGTELMDVASLYC